jgi:hypothetical protein
MSTVADRTARRLPVRGRGAPGANATAREWARRHASALAILAMAGVCAVLLAAPGMTVTTKYLPDLFVLLDGAHRVAEGQVPSRDFHTVLGPLAHYLPAAGLALVGDLGGALPIGSALFVLLLAPAMAHVLGSRLRTTIAVPFGLFLILIASVPINLGETVTSLSFARFYDRVGWAALGTLLVLYLPPLRLSRHGALLDALAAALLVLVMLYTKATYAAAAVAFLAFLLLDAGQRRWAATALAVTVAAALAIEALWRSSAAYAADLALAAEVSGGLRGSAGQIAEQFLRNFADYVLFALAAGLALWRTRSARDLAFFLFCAVAGFLLINQNGQSWGIVSLYAGAAVAAERLAREHDAPDGRKAMPVGLGAPLFLLALVLPTIAHSLIALGLHAGIAAARAGEEVGLAKTKGIRLVHLWTWGEHESATDYLASLREGAQALASLDGPPRGVFVLDQANPFSAGLGLAPARGDTPGLQWERTVDADTFIPPERLLADVDVVMEPKAPAGDERPIDQPGSSRAVGGLRQIYGPAIAADFERVRETDRWTIHRRRTR